MTALDTGAYAKALADFGASVSPSAVLVISAHWEDAGIRIAAGLQPQLIYDFGGFPRELYLLKYPARGWPALAKDVAAELVKSGFESVLDERRGWDHGVWVPLRLMFPDAVIPIVEISLPMEWDAKELYRLGTALSPFRERGVLVMGSGGIVHNLRRLNWAEKEAMPEQWAKQFQDWVRDEVIKKDIESLFRYKTLAPHAEQAVPTPDHFHPLFAVLGASAEYSRVIPIFEGIEHGSLSMYSFQLVD